MRSINELTYDIPTAVFSDSRLNIKKVQYNGSFGQQNRDGPWTRAVAQKTALRELSALKKTPWPFVKISCYFVRFQLNWIVYTDFSLPSRLKLSPKSMQWVISCFTQADRQTNGQRDGRMTKGKRNQ
jgi:hypothetical protein